MRIATTTIDALFTWYMGGDWKEDWQTTNTMTVDGVHAQSEEDEDGEETLEHLAKNAEASIEVSGEQDSHGTWDLDFVLEGKAYSIQACGFYGDEE
jgi:hypothetical protein